ncbi:MAG: acyltransferase [Pseudomonadaceae bacterium]|nr:acyltransferase [Pseudomonadaceae bacterium]
MEKQQPQQRNQGLDTLRALAVIIVLANHCFLGLLVSTGKIAWEGPSAYISSSAVVSIEWLFVLSGYLIGAIMIRSLERSGANLSGCWDFWLRRWFRTLPCYYLFLLVNIVVSNLIPGVGSFEASYLIFSQNLIYPEAQPHFYGESWSLAIDEWFYIIMPILVYGIIKAARLSLRKSFYLTAIILIAVPAIMRLLHAVPADFFAWDAQIRRITLYHLDATGWGVLAAAINRWSPRWWLAGINFKACLGLIATCLGLMAIWKLVHSGWEQTLAFSVINSLSISLMGIGTLLLLPLITRLQLKSAPVTAAVASISTYSYTLYLSHFPLIFIIRFNFDLNKSSSLAGIFLACGVWLVAVFVVSVLVYRWFEKPISDLREKFTTNIAAAPFSVRPSS